MMKTTLTVALVVGAAGLAGTAGFRLAQHTSTDAAAMTLVAGPEDKAKEKVKKVMREFSAQDAKPQRSGSHEEKKLGGDPMSEVPDATAEMEQWMKMSQPGAQHTMLAKGVGHWDATTSFQMGPDAPPMDGTAKMHIKPVLGGRYFQADFVGDEMAGQKFYGLGFHGYDNARGQFVSTWMDSMGTGIMYMTGQMSEDNKTLTLSGSHMGPMGETMMKIVSTTHDDNHFTDEFFDQMPDGTWMKTGTIKYSRIGDFAEVHTP